MEIVEPELSLFKTNYGNWFFFLLPFINVCGFDKYYHLNVGWLFFAFNCYIKFGKK